VEAIQKDGFLKPSLEDVSSVDGQGQYFTDISSEEASATTKGQFLYSIYQFPFGWAGTDVSYLKFLMSKKSVQRVSNTYGARFPGKGIYLRRSLLIMKFIGPNTDAVLLGFGKVVFFGGRRFSTKEDLMQELPMLDEIPGNSIESAIRFLDELKWSIRIVETDGTWRVAAGHRLVLKSSSRDAVDALLYGLALAYSVLPKPILDQFRKYGEDATS
jgi:hypothetical protein